MFIYLLMIVIIISAAWLIETYQNVTLSDKYSDRRSGRERRQQLQLFQFNDRRARLDRRLDK